MDESRVRVPPVFTDRHGFGRWWLGEMKPMPSPVDPVRILFLHDHLLENGGLRVVHNLILQLQGSSVQPSMFVLQSQSPGAVLAPSREVRVVFGVRRRLQLRWAILP